MKQPILVILDRWLPVLFWASLIFTLSSFSTLPSAQKYFWDFVLKKFAHLFEYGVLYFLLVRALGKRTPRHLALAFLICLLYAGSDEIHQSFTPGRYPKITDIGFDSLGMLVAYLRIKSLI